MKLRGTTWFSPTILLNKLKMHYCVFNLFVV